MLGPLIDRYDRSIDYLRVSLTDRCNLRCRYCMPADYKGQRSRDHSLTDSELLRLLRVFVSAGIQKIRLTGGEPLVRPGIIDLVSKIAKLPGLQDVSLTTNGMLLKRMAGDLVNAGLKRVNISLDTLQADRFQWITRLGDLDDVQQGIEEAMRVGLQPVKLNVVVARGMNETELPAFVQMTKESPLHVRFIELMPMGNTGFFSSDKHVSLEEMMQLAGPLQPVSADETPTGHGPARYYKAAGAKGTVGFIHALSCSFCSLCNRMRLDHDGKLLPCLDGGTAIDFKTLVRSGASDAEVHAMLLSAIDQKPEEHHMLERVDGSSPSARAMCAIGG